MKTTLAWGAKNTGGKFNITAANLDGALTSLCKLKEWGKFQGDVKSTSKGDAKGNCTSVALTASYTITMPAWGALSKQPKQCQDEWNRMSKCLREHEDGHLEVFQNGLTALVKELTALKEGTHDDVGGIVKEALASIQTGHNKFDASTNHGASKGVNLTIADGCGGEAEAEE